MEGKRKAKGEKVEESTPIPGQFSSDTAAKLKNEDNIPLPAGQDPQEVFNHSARILRELESRITNRSMEMPTPEIDPAYVEKLMNMPDAEFQLAAAHAFERCRVYSGLLMHQFMKTTEEASVQKAKIDSLSKELENEKNARVMAEDNVKELTRTVSELRSTVAALTLEKNELLVLAEKSK